MTKRWLAALAAASLLLLACSGDDDPDPGKMGNDQTEVDGGETDAGSSTITTGQQPGGDAGGATDGNQIAPGDTTEQTSQMNG